MVHSLQIQMSAMMHKVDRLRHKLCVVERISAAVCCCSLPSTVPAVDVLLPPGMVVSQSQLHTGAPGMKVSGVVISRYP